MYLRSFWWFRSGIEPFPLIEEPKGSKKRGRNNQSPACSHEQHIIDFHCNDSQLGKRWPFLLATRLSSLSWSVEYVEWMTPSLASATSFQFVSRLPQDPHRNDQLKPDLNSKTGFVRASI